jgi:WD40 repeat protein
MGRIRVFDVSRPEAVERATFECNGTPAGFSADGRTLATLGHGRLLLWDASPLADGKPPRLRIDPLGHDGDDPYNPLWSGFTPDGRTAITAGGGTIRLWDIAGGRAVHRDELSELECGRPNGLPLALSADGRTLAVHRTKSRFEFSHLSEGRFEKHLVLPRGGRFLALSPDGSRLAVIADSRWAAIGPVDDLAGRRWADLHTRWGDRLIPMSARSRPVQFSPDGRRLFVIALHAEVLTLDVSTDTPRLEKVCRIPGLKEWWNPALSPDGGLLAWTHPDGKDVAIWDVTAEAARLRSRVAVPGLAETRNLALALGPGGQSLATVARDYEVSVWDVASGKLRKHWRMPQKVHSVTFLPDGKHLAVNNRNSTVYILRLP